MLYLRLVAGADGETLLQITSAMVGNLSDATLEQTRDGWRMLFEDGLKKYIESR
jgi:hypothetical protein